MFQTRFHMYCTYFKSLKSFLCIFAGKRQRRNILSLCGGPNRVYCLNIGLWYLISDSGIFLWTPILVLSSYCPPVVKSQDTIDNNQLVQSLERKSSWRIYGKYKNFFLKLASGQCKVQCPRALTSHCWENLRDMRTLFFWHSNNLSLTFAMCVNIIQ